MSLVECVPNFSEGRDQKVIDAIANAISSVSGVSLLDVDPGISTNRTVMTFVGAPEAVLEGAFQGISTAANLIDMRNQQGEHPRIGATDVCPFVPVAESSIKQCTELAKTLGKRVGDELSIPVYLYAGAAQRPDRVSLSDIRKGEYEGLIEKMKLPDFAPDFGPNKFNPKSGATVIGAREFLIAYNINLNTKSPELANQIALQIRESGRPQRDGSGKIIRDSQGNKIMIPGILPACRAVGWYIDEYHCAQVSINLTDYKKTSMHNAFDEVSRIAETMGLKVTGSEIVGLVPLAPMLNAGAYYLKKQGQSIGVADSKLIETAVKSLGLAELASFDPNKKIIEYRVSKEKEKLIAMDLSQFLDELSSDSPAPGGGSVSALCAALAASLSSMVANLTYGKKGFEKDGPVMEDVAVKAQKLKSEFTYAIDKDTEAFNAVIKARRLPKSTPQEQENRQSAIETANKQATQIPFSVLSNCLEIIPLIHQVVEKGNPHSLSDAGMAALAARAAAVGAYYNILINLKEIVSEQFKCDMRTKADKLMASASNELNSIDALVLERLLKI